MVPNVNKAAAQMADIVRRAKQPARSSPEDEEQGK